MNELYEFGFYVFLCDLSFLALSKCLKSGVGWYA